MVDTGLRGNIVRIVIVVVKCWNLEVVARRNVLIFGDGDSATLGRLSKGSPVDRGQTVPSVGHLYLRVRANLHAWVMRAGHVGPFLFLVPGISMPHCTGWDRIVGCWVVVVVGRWWGVVEVVEGTGRAVRGTTGVATGPDEEVG